VRNPYFLGKLISAKQQSIMHSKRFRLDRFLIKKLQLNNREVRLLLAQQRIEIDQQPAVSMNQSIDEFTHIQVDGKIIQSNKPCYIKLHKPKGYVSATKDATHKTVIDLLPLNIPKNLHIAGRLDFNSTGLLLLTNDGRWSRKLSQPSSNIKKRYRVTLDKPVDKAVIKAFKEGLYFSFEKITTLPAELISIDQNIVEVTLKEGKYHQIKRMFGHFQIEVLNLHRLSIGNLYLENSLQEAQSKNLTTEEINDIFR
jgi:16S rRNA pseudouridine516 synthase